MLVYNHLMPVGISFLKNIAIAESNFYGSWDKMFYRDA